MRQSKRNTAYQDPYSERLFSCPQRVYCKNASAEQNKYKPTALNPTGCKTKTGNVQYQLGKGRYRKQNAFNKYYRTHCHSKTIISDIFVAAFYHDPQQEEIQRHYLAQFKKSLSGILGDSKTFGQSTRKRSEYIRALYEEEYQVQGTKSGHY